MVKARADSRQNNKAATILQFKTEDFDKFPSKFVKNQYMYFCHNGGFSSFCQLVIKNEHNFKKIICYPITKQYKQYCKVTLYLHLLFEL